MIINSESDVTSLSRLICHVVHHCSIFSLNGGIDTSGIVDINEREQVPGGNKLWRFGAKARSSSSGNFRSLSSVGVILRVFVPNILKASISRENLEKFIRTYRLVICVVILSPKILGRVPTKGSVCKPIMILITGTVGGPILSSALDSTI